METLEAMRRQHPAWRLLAAESAALVASFLHCVFVLPNWRVIAQADLTEALEDTLYALREQRGASAYPKGALEYLNDWAANDKAWLRKFYPTGSDEPHFDLTPATERTLAWLATLSERSFVGTESRLLTLFELLRQMSEGSETDPRTRVRELERKHGEVDAEIARVLPGDMPLLGDTALKERFMQFATLARELLADFREVEHNFRGWTAVWVSASRCGTAARVRCCRTSWASATRSQSPTRAAGAGGTPAQRRILRPP